MKILFRPAAALLLSLAVLAGTAVGLPARAAAAEGTVSDNADNRYVYGNYTAPDQSALYRDGSGLVRVEHIGDQILVEGWDSSFQVTGQQWLDMELPLYGGFFAGSQYNFLIFGQENPDESDTAEVIRVVKYSKDWKRLGAASLYGENTTIPFSSGGLDCAEQGGVLWVHTCHEMYQSEDGLNHQANLTFTVRQSDMAVTGCRSGIGTTSSGYASHSFQQRILADSQGRVVTADHGDAYPRAIVLNRYTAGVEGYCEKAVIQTFPDPASSDMADVNRTGACLGSLTETETCYIVTYSYDGVGGGGGRGVFLAAVDKDTLAVTVRQVAQPTAAAGSLSATTPYAVSTGTEGYVLWNETLDGQLTGELSYARYDSSGEITGRGSNRLDRAILSDCRPIWDGSRVVWYTTERTSPRFFLLEGDTLSVEPFDTEAHTLTAVTITGFDAPIAGKLAVSTQLRAEEAGVSCSLTWLDSSGQALDSREDRFQAGGVYTARISVRASYRYTFAEDAAFTVNGEAWEAVREEEAWLLTRTFPPPQPLPP